jgi:hypothetical protein
MGGPGTGIFGTGPFLCRRPGESLKTAYLPCYLKQIKSTACISFSFFSLTKLEFLLIFYSSNFARENQTKEGEMKQAIIIQRGTSISNVIARLKHLKQLGIINVKIVVGSN